LEATIAFGRVLRKLRIKAELTQEQLGFEADIRRTYVSILELGQQQPSLSTIIKLAHALKISTAEMMAMVELELDRNNP
jgi:transcriptional regulator with XRE-family HTH domain